jgi:hypothetical protein
MSQLLHEIIARVAGRGLKRGTLSALDEQRPMDDQSQMPFLTKIANKGLVAI